MTSQIRKAVESFPWTSKTGELMAVKIGRSQVIGPLVGSKIPVIILIREVFPAPFGPIKPRISPSSACKEMFFMARIFLTSLFAQSLIVPQKTPSL